jgi:ferrochelatase
MREALRFGSGDPTGTRVIFTAHSIPLAMASACNYESELQETCRLVAEEVGIDNWKLVYQSRSGPPHQPWLEPDICDYLESLDVGDVGEVAVAPIGFLSDHLEVIYDLDTEASQVCEKLGIKMKRVATVGTHPAFIRMIRGLIEERLTEGSARLAIGSEPAPPDTCPEGCCYFTSR